MNLNLTNETVARTPATAKSRSDFFPSIVIALLPFGVLAEVGIIGRIFLTEVLLLIMLPFFLIARGTPLVRTARSVFWFLGLWLLALVTADFYRDSSPGDYLRGWAKLIFFGINLYVLYKLLTTQQRVLVSFLGSSIASSIAAWQEFPELAVAWKYGIGGGCLLAIASLLLMVWRPPTRALLLLLASIALGFAVTSLLLNARSSFLEMTVASCLLALCAFPNLRDLFAELWDRHGIVVLLGVLAMGYIMGYAYVLGAGAGIFGDEARAKLEMQRLDSFDPVLGILAGGRPEAFSSWAAIGDSPIIGYGSWAHGAEYFNVYLNAERTYGSPEAAGNAERKQYGGDPLIPTHSHLFGAWVEAGIAGAVFWTFVIYLLLRAVRRALSAQSATDVLILLAATPMLWDILFSPFGAERRLAWGGAMVLLLFNTVHSSPSSEVSRSNDRTRPSAP